MTTLSKTLPRTLIDQESGNVRDDIDTAARDSCDAASAHFLPSTALQESRVEPGYFLPSEGAWGAGARWVRCDFAIIAYGSSFADPRLEKLPAKISDFVHDAESTPQILALCVITEESTEASDLFNSDTATYADATGEVWITYEPTTDSWKTGDRTVECWVASALSLRVRDGCSATRPLRRKPRYRALARGRVIEERCANTLDTRY